MTNIPNWTIDPTSGRSNSSPEFNALVKVVARLLRNEAHSLILGQSDTSARLIMAQLAHVHGLVPCPRKDCSACNSKGFLYFDTPHEGRC